LRTQAHQDACQLVRVATSLSRHRSEPRQEDAPVVPEASGSMAEVTGHWHPL